ncbi:hypothetical protein ACJMK2_010161 [Sinanodonta woodiana]|uniref:Methionine--tRNA ligase, cytoplasmic n=1 Tax=Sinanodonta woodiana TaxID=1069815 RepID=A0ABD3VEG9_SINWO
MKLYTDHGNFQTLKIIVASEISGVKLEIVHTKSDEKVVTYLSSCKLPALEVHPEKFLFSANAAARYLTNLSWKETDPSALDQWLEWESAVLLPIVFPYLVSLIGQGKTEEHQLTCIHGYLEHLDTELNGRQAFCGDQVTVADIVLWSSLYPVLNGKFCLKGWESQYKHLQAWNSHLANLQPFKAAVKIVLGDRDTSVLKASLLAQPVPQRAKDVGQAGQQRQKQGKGAPEEVQVNVEKPTATDEEITEAIAAWTTGHSLCPKPRIRRHPIIPEEVSRNILITSALPYVNNVPHLGNIIGCVLSADVFSRYCRLRNYNCLYVCGTDEYGTATETKAIEEGLTPQQICDKYNVIHEEIYRWFNIDFDYFGRTTTKQQTEIAQDIFWRLYNRDLILKDSIDQLQCERCDRFLADRFVEGTCPFCAFDDARGDQCDACGKLINAIELKNPKCKLCRNSPVVKSTQHLFLDLPKVFYVWFDAPIGYISITANYTDHWKKWWKNPQQVELYNFLGKDNVPFHSVIFPCTLLGADDGYTIVNHMIATEYLNYEDGKFSKSRGTGVFGNQAKDTGIPADIYRFYLLYIRPETQDSSFSWDDFLLKNNTELLNNLGNFINRALKFVDSNFGGVIQQMDLTSDEFNLLALINRELHTYIENMEQAKVLYCLGQSYFPWMNHMAALFTEAKTLVRHKAGTVCSLCANIGCLLSVLLQPYMPDVSRTIQEQLNAPQECYFIYKDFVCQLLPGHKMGKPFPLFQKIEPATIEELKKKFSGQPGSVPPKAAANKKSQVKTAESVGPASTASPEEVEKLTAEVAEQGNKVRDLKTNKADKSLIAVEVAKLLELKKKLTLTQGSNPKEAAEDKDGKKKGKKK